MSSSDYEDRLEESRQADALCFYLPLPSPLALSEDAIISLQDFDAKTADHLTGVRSSVKFHQITVARSADAYLISRIMDLAHHLHSDHPLDSQVDEGPPLRVDVTVAEVVVPNPQDDPLGVAIEAVQEVQKAISLMSAVAVPLLTRQRLPFIVPCFSQSLGPDGTVVWGGPSIWVATDTMAITRLTAIRPAPVELEGLQQALHQVSRGGPFIAAAELHAEAQVHWHHHGDYRASVLALASACEVQLDAILMGLLWEEGADPSVASRYFGVNGLNHTKRVLSEFAPRLKGNWSRADGPVADYLQCVVQLRQRVMHAGHAPTEAEAELAHEAASALSAHVEQLLRDKATQDLYPRVAVMFCGPGRLDREGCLHPTARALVNDDSEDWWFSQHALWCEWARRYSDVNPPMPGREVENMDLVLEVDSRGWRLLVVDVAVGAAAEVVDPDDALGSVGTPHEEVSRIIRAVRSTLGPGDPPVLVEIDAAVSPDWLEGLAWRRSFDVFPDLDPRPRARRQYGPFRLPGQ